MNIVDVEKTYVPHIVKNGVRYHVVSLIGYKGNGYNRCSEPNCEINKQYDKSLENK